MLNCASTILRRMPGGYVHWCSGCCRLHVIPRIAGDASFDAAKPTLPSRISHIDAANSCCSYTMREGIIEYAPSCGHWLAGKALPMMTLPDATDRAV
jgi:hypothetical protein